MEQALLILDLDETLIHARLSPLGRPPDFVACGYSVYERPGLTEFLARVDARYRVGIWSSAGTEYVREVVAKSVSRRVKPELVWGGERATIRRDFTTDEWFGAKHLKKVRRRGYDLERVLIVDDEPRKVANCYGNAIYVRPFEGDPSDRELLLLAEYLERIADVTKYRSLEKRSWRYDILNAPAGHDRG